jgi:hypothetical protein
VTIASHIRVDGQRRVWIAKAGIPLRCSPDRDGHRLADPLVWDHGCIRCTQKLKSGTGECGRLIYLLGGGIQNLRGEPVFMLTYVTPEEMRAMRDKRMDWEQAVTYLGIGFFP